MSHINCPTCGAKTDSVFANCEYCGVEFAKANTLTPQEFVAAVGRAVVAAKEKAGSLYEDEAERTAVMNTPIPSDIPTLTAFFMFCNSNVLLGLDGMNATQKAWKGKAKGSYDMLRLASMNNPQLSAFLEEYKSIYSAEALKSADSAESRFYLILAVALFLGYVYTELVSK